MRNGRVPKEEADRRRKEQIKGELDPQLSRELLRLKEKWHPIIYKHTLATLEWRRKQAAEFLERHDWKDPVPPVARDKESREKYEGDIETLAYYAQTAVIQWESVGRKRHYYLASDRVFEELSQTQATDESEGFYFKMADKLGGFVMDIGKELTAVEDVDRRNASPFDSSIRFRFSDNSHFVVKNSIVMSTSVRGLAFFRYPTTFHDAFNARGEKIANPDELSVKAAFIDDIRVRGNKR